MRRFLSLCFCVCVLSICQNVFSATTLYVSSSGAGTACSSDSPCTLNQALSAASSNGDDNTINLAAGTYSSSSAFTYTASNHSLTLSGAGADSTFVTATADNAMNFTFSGTVTVSGITVQDSSGSGLRFSNDASGSSFNVSISNCSFLNNHDSGVWIENPDADLDGAITIHQSTFDGNSTGTRGGGLHIETGATIPVEVTNNLFNQNHADGNGGGVWIHNLGADSPTTFQGNTLQYNNSLDTGGGAYFQNQGGTESPIVIGGATAALGNTFSFNNATNTGAVSAHSEGGGGMTFQNNIVTGNTGFTEGGAINLIIYLGDIVFSNNTIQNNPNLLGGAFQVQTVNTGQPTTFTMNANLISGNSGTDFGGGSLAFAYLSSPAVITNNVFVDNFGVSSSSSVGAFGIGSSTDQAINITNNTFANNISNSFAGGLFLSPTNAAIVFNVYNNLFWENESAYPQEADLFVYSPIWTGMNLYNNDLTTVCVDGTPATCNSGSDFSGLANTNASANLYNTDPLFVGTGDLVNYYSLQSTSPVIQQGDSDAPNLPSYDYTGLVLIDTPPDLGALQFAIYGLSITITSDASSVGVGDDLSWTVTLTNASNAFTGDLTAEIMGENQTIISVSCSDTDPLACSLSSLEPGASVTFQVTTQAAEVGTLTLSVSVSNGGSTISTTSSGSAIATGIAGGCGLNEFAPFHLSNLWIYGGMLLLWLTKRKIR